MARAKARGIGALVLLAAAANPAAFAHCAPAPDSPYFFRDLTEQRVEAKRADDRVFLEGLLSRHFEMRSPDGQVIARRDFIERELGDTDRSYTVSNFTLLEHRKGFVVAHYLLTERSTPGRAAHASGQWMRDVYQVEDGKWRLASSEIDQPLKTALAD
jgi:hypothetical protein